ncbi:MAG TPA: hypothetical protein PLL88_01020 [Anaerolineaceae bacterium]|jgi:hypothetical protein|nr:hypothetical protein [Anaerolineaceae bacterium]
MLAAHRYLQTQIGKVEVADPQVAVLSTGTPAGAFHAQKCRFADFASQDKHGEMQWAGRAMPAFLACQ